MSSPAEQAALVALLREGRRPWQVYAELVEEAGSAPSADGIAEARHMAGDLADAGYTVFSGLAAGIDTAAHTATLAGGGRTVAVVGTGLRHCYPAENVDLAHRIARECALVSQFWPDSPPTRRSFPMRNAVMSGMTLGIVIEAASHTSVTRVTAR